MSDKLPSEANPAEIAYSEAKRLAQEGDFAAALERHEWFHAHALSHQPSYYGVRLSFALATWKELGQKYPPALKSLKRIRDRDSDRLRAGAVSDSLFHDVVAINRTLEDDAQTMTLFRKIEATSQETAQRLFRFMIEEALIAAPDLFVRYTPDLMGHYTSMSTRHCEMRQRIATTLTRACTTPHAEGAIRDQLMKFDASFLASAKQLAQLAEKSDRLEVSAQILTSADALIQELQATPAAQA